MPVVHVAVLSDIHSNYHAFRACYEDAVSRGAERFIFLGDYVSDLAEPDKTLDLLSEIREKFPAVCLLGNRERYMLECKRGSCVFSPGSKSGSLFYTFHHLRPKDFQFFESLNPSDTIIINGIPIEIAHAAMDDDRCFFDGDDSQTGTIFQNMQHRYLLTGHSHKQYIRHQGDKTIINPGSVGIPQDGTLWPKYALLRLSEDTISCQLRQVPYDRRDVIHAQFASGLVDVGKYWAIGALYDIINGKECVMTLLKQVEESGDVSDEECWDSVAARMGMAHTEEEIIDHLLKGITIEI